MLDDFTPVAVLIFFAVAFAAVVLALARFLSSLNPPGAKGTTYECGVRPVGDAREPVPVSFYVVAMLFILFDIEATFLYPWATVFKRLGVFGLIEMIIFLGVLIAGFVYIWRRGVLEWRA